MLITPYFREGRPVLHLLEMHITNPLVSLDAVPSFPCPSEKKGKEELRR